MKSNYPKWSELPEIDLYLDQVLLYVNQVGKPVKKKYNRKQVARLIVITALKNVFSIQEISQTLALLTDEDQSQKRYDDFVACMNGEKMDDLPPVVVSACQTLKLYFQTHELVHALEGESHEN